jgi:pyruvate kinase
MKLALQKKTKIVATISDIRCEVDFLKELYETGMNVVRVNTAHQTTESSLKILENVRKVSDKIGILVDTKGPEIRTTPMADGKGFDVRTGDTIKVAGNPEAFSSSEMLYMNYAGFVKDVNIGNSILIDDGELKFTVIEKTEEYLTCRAENGGTVKGKKTVNVPAVPMTLPSLSKRDVEYINWAIDNNIDFIAHSFVRSKEDALAVQQIISERKSSIKLIAKIENQQGVDNIEEILEHVYGIMVARGDLGVEIEAEKIPGIQKMLIEKAQLYEKPVIIATQMLHTMIEHPRPTRAEVTDVANAIYQRTDAIMLSGETAYGAYPVEAVRTMTKVAIETEHLLKPHTGQKHTGLKDKVAVSIAKSAVQISEELPIKAFITDSYYGQIGRAHV